MTEETNELNEKDVQRIADALYKKMKEKQEKEMKEQHDEAKEETNSDYYAVCDECGRILTWEQYRKPACPYCDGTKARVITK